MPWAARLLIPLRVEPSCAASPGLSSPGPTDPAAHGHQDNQHCVFGDPRRFCIPSCAASPAWQCTLSVGDSKTCTAVSLGRHLPPPLSIFDNSLPHAHLCWAVLHHLRPSQHSHIHPAGTMCFSSVMRQWQSRKQRLKCWDLIADQRCHITASSLCVPWLCLCHLHWGNPSLFPHILPILQCLDKLTSQDWPHVAAVSQPKLRSLELWPVCCWA